MNDSFNPQISPWRIDDSEFYELGSFDDRMRFLLRYAVLAPSTRNTQPWVFLITKGGVEVYADYTRRLRAADRGGRELFMSVGAAIANFRVAAAHFGFDTKVLHNRRPEERTPVASISVCETCAPDGALASLFRAIPKRHTNPAPFDGEPIEPDHLEPLCDLIERFPDTLRLFLPRNNAQVAEMIEEGDRRQLASPAFRAAALLLVTADDDRIALIRAGEVLELLLLTITESGLAYSFLDQPAGVEALRERIRALAGADRPAQLLIRIGHAQPVDEAMPRRPLEWVMALTGDSGRKARIAWR